MIDQSKLKASAAAPADKSNKLHIRKIIKSSILAFVLFFLGGTVSNTGWASAIAVAALGDALIYLVGFGLVVSVFAALAAALLTFLRRRFIQSFANIYSIAMIIFAVIILIGSFPRF